MNGGIALQLAIDALAAGAVYALVALAVYVAHAGSGVLHLAAGDVAMGAVLAGTLLSDHGGGAAVAAAVVVALLLGAAGSAALEWLVVRPTRGRVALSAAALVAAGTGVRQAVAAGFVRPAYPFPAPDQVWRFGGGVVRGSDLVSIAVVAMLAVAAHVVVARTRAGAALRITAVGGHAAETVGVDTRRVRAAAFAVAGALAVGAALLAAPRLTPAPAAGVPLLLKGVAAAAAGRLASPLAVCAGAVLIGTAEVLSTYWLGGGGEAVTYGVAFVALALGWRR